MHRIINLRKCELFGYRTCEIIVKEQKHPCHIKLYAFRLFISRTQVLNLRSRNEIRGKLLLSRKLWQFREGAVSHNVLYHQPLLLLVTRKVYANNYFDWLPIVSTAFKWPLPKFGKGVFWVRSWIQGVQVVRRNRAWNINFFYQLFLFSKTIRYLVLFDACINKYHLTLEFCLYHILSLASLESHFVAPGSEHFISVISNTLVSLF